MLNDEVDSLRGAPKGATYTLTAWVRASSAGTQSIIKAREVGSGQNYTHSAQLRLTSTDWQQVSLTFVTQYADSTLDVNVLFTGFEVGKAVYVDSVSLVGASEQPVTQPPVTQPPVTQPPAAEAPSVEQPANPGVCTRPAPKGTKFGVSATTGDQSMAQSLSSLDKLFGRVPIVRIFDPGMVMAWDKPRTQMVAGRDLVISFRPSPQEVLTGKYDAEFSRWFKQAPSNVNIFWSYIHEPEPMIDQGKFTAEQYRRAWQRIEGIADSVCRSNMYPTLILTGWTTTPASKRDWRTYYPGASVIDVMAFDPYNGVHDPGRDYYASVPSMFDSAVRVAREAGKPWAIAETGSRKIKSDPSGSQRAAWLNEMASYSRQNGATFVTYFQSTRDGDWRLLDGPSTKAWGTAMGNIR